MITFSNILALFIGIWAAVAAVYVAYAAYNILVVLPKYGKLCFGISRNKFIWVSTRAYEENNSHACDNAYREGYRNGLEAHLFNTDADDADWEWEDADFESDITFESEEEYEEWYRHLVAKARPTNYEDDQYAVHQHFEQLQDQIDVEMAQALKNVYATADAYIEERFPSSADDTVPKHPEDFGC